MKKTISALIIFLMFLVPALSNASHIIRLKNGGQLTTPGYWTEGKWVFFFCVGGTAGIERSVIERIERYETDDLQGMSLWDPAKTAPPPARAEKAAEPKAAAPENQPAKPKLDLKEAKERKERMTSELDGLAEKMREAARVQDNEAKEKIREQLRNMGTQIYKLTDEVKEQNKGKLPDGWWER